MLGVEYFERWLPEMDMGMPGKKNEDNRLSYHFKRKTFWNVTQFRLKKYKQGAR